MIEIGDVKPAAECTWCQWPAKYYVYRGKAGDLKFKTCPEHLALGVDRAELNGNALVKLIR